jgi:hypothetical protein
MTLLWPRIEAHIALTTFEQLHGMAVPELTAQASMSHDAQTYASTGGTRADDSALAVVRRTIRGAAEQFGFPGSRGDPVAFDRHLAPLLVEAMPMATGEALTRSVWNFTSMVLAPDITCWRFGFSNRERWLCSDRTRHMFSRLWWQAFLLTEATPEGRDARLLDGLTESDLNQLLERTSIGGCRPLVRAIARSLVELAPEERHRDVVRDVSLRLLRLTGVIEPFALSDEELDDLVAKVVRESMRALSNVGT